MADRCKRCGDDENAMIHLYDREKSLAGHPFEPEDAAPAPGVCQCDSPARTNSIPWACGNCNKPFVLPKAATHVEAGARVAGQLCRRLLETEGYQEFYCENAKPCPKHDEPAAGQVDAEQWLKENRCQFLRHSEAQEYSGQGHGHLQTVTVSHLDEAAMLDAYAVHRTKGMEAQWRGWGVIEVAVRNPQVADYCAHWEGRAEAAEARNVELVGDITKMERDIGNALTDYNDEKALREAVEKRLAEAQKALQAAKSIMWMAKEYAEGGGTYGPEMRDYEKVMKIIKGEDK